MDKLEIIKKCRLYNITNYTISDDGVVDVDGCVVLYDKNLTKIPIKFGKVSGYFTCAHNKLTSLKNSPTHVGDDFFCQKNNLTSLSDGPEYVGGDFITDKIKSSKLTYDNYQDMYIATNYSGLVKSKARNKKISNILGS